MKFTSIVFTILFACLWNLGVAQNYYKIDSLNRVLEKKEGVERFDPLFELVREYANNFKPKDALAFLEEAEPIAFLYGDTAKIVRASRAKGQLYSRLGRHREALTIFRYTFPIAKRHQLDKDLAITYDVIGEINIFLANYPEGLKYLFQALPIYERLGDKYYISGCLGTIGLAYYKLFDNQKALDYYLKALTLRKEANDSHSIDALHINIGLCYSSLSKWDLARENFAKGFQACDNNCKNIKIWGGYGYGRLAFLQNDFDGAEPHLKTSYQLAVEENDYRHQSENLLLLGKIEMHREKYTEAKKILLESARTSLIEGYKHILVNIYSSLSDLYNKQKQYEQSAAYQKKFIAYRDSIVNEDIANKLAVIQIEFEQQQNAVTIANNNEIIKRQRIQTALVSVITVLLAGLAFALYKIIRSKQEINNKLDHKVRARTLELELSRDVLQRSYAEQTNFFNKTVKEIQAPLASLKGIDNILLLEFSGKNAQPYASSIQVATRKLDQLVRNLTQINVELSNGFSAISILTLLQTAIEKVRSKKSDIKIDLLIAESIVIQTNHELMQRLLDDIFELASSEMQISVNKEAHQVVLKIEIRQGLTRQVADGTIEKVLEAARFLNTTVGIENSMESGIVFRIAIRDF